MRKLLLFVLVVFLFILGAGLSALPEVFRRGYAIPGTGDGLPGLPTGLFLLNLANLVLFIGVLLAIIFHHYVRLMIGLFIALRAAQVIYEYILGRHSLWYLAVMILIYLIVGGGTILLLTRAGKDQESIS